jgi:hypothetical protein
VAQQRAARPRASSKSARTENVAAAVNFSGRWILDRARSDRPDAVLKILGVPWVARKAIGASSRSIVIEHDPSEQRWRETVTTSVIRNVSEFPLDGSDYTVTSPVDGSIVTSRSFVEAEKEGVVVTVSCYKKGGHTQKIRRWIDRTSNGGGGGRRGLYRVRNELTCGQTGRTAVVETVFVPG